MKIFYNQFIRNIKKIFITIFTFTLFLNLSYFLPPSLKKIQAFDNNSLLFEGIEKKKNLILIIADGMGFPTLSLLMNYHMYENNANQAFVNFINQSDLALTFTNSNDSVVTDSAASATAIASGQKTNNFYVGVDKNNEKLKTLSHFFKEKKKSVGIISNTRISHATPAAFYGHNNNRNDETNIAKDLLESNIDLILGGGLGFFIDSNFQDDRIPYTLKSSRTDNLNLMPLLKNKGFQFVYSKEQLNGIKSKENKNPIIGLFANSHLPYYIDQINQNTQEIPSLADMASKSLEILGNNPNGFFLMIESGLIDISEHDVDMGALLYELMQTNQLILKLSEYVEKNPDTLIILTSDHETGGLGFTYFYPIEKDYLNKELNLELDIFSHVKNSKSGPFYQKPEVLKEIWNMQKISLKAIWSAIFDKEKSNNEILHVNAQKLTELLNKNFPTQMSQKKVENIFLIQNNKIQLKELFSKYETLVKYHGGPKEIARIFYAIIVTQLITPYYGITWNTGGHIANLVPTMIYGNWKNNPTKSIFNQKIIQNSDIFKICLELIN